MTELQAIINNKSVLNKLSLTYRNGLREDITETFYNCGNQERLQTIPQNHVIIGIYGSLSLSTRLTSLGFILMDITAYRP